MRQTAAQNLPPRADELGQRRDNLFLVASGTDDDARMVSGVTDETKTDDSSEREVTQPWKLRDLATRHAQRRRRSLAAELHFKRGRLEMRVPLERDETVIGRDPTCDIVLLEKSVSTRHARIVRNDGGYFVVEDLGSTNGVVVDGALVDRMTLLEGDVFVVGDTAFTVVIAPVVGSPETAA